MKKIFLKIIKNNIFIIKNNLFFLIKIFKNKKKWFNYKNWKIKIIILKNQLKNKSINFGFKSWITLIYPYLLILIFLIILPLLIVILYSIIKATNNAWIFKFTFDNFNNFFKEKSYIIVLLRSINYAFIASLIAVLFGYPVAYIIAFIPKKIFAQNILFLITLPIFINILLRTIGLKIIFNIINPDILLGTTLGIILAMIYMFMPFVILPIYNSLEKIDKNLLEASQDLGASKIKTFWKITLRFSISGIISGFILMMLSAMTSLVLIKYISDGKTILITNIIESYFYRGENFTYGAAISVILGIIILIIIFTLKSIGKWITKKNK